MLGLNTSIPIIFQFCGDGVVNNKGREECDDRNNVIGDGCNNCHIEVGEVVGRRNLIMNSWLNNHQLRLPKKKK